MPSDYITELAARAYANITKEKWRQTAEIHIYLPEKPTTAAVLEQALATQRALQARIAWHVRYTPSKWLLENELDVVKGGKDPF